MTSVEDLVEDPIKKLLIEHDDRIRILEAQWRIGLTIGGGGLTLLAAILTTLLLKG